MEKHLITETSDLIKTSMGNYGYNINLLRTFPNINDGLKLVQRRILYSMHRMNLLPSGNYKKCVGVVGYVLNYAHVHGW